MPSTFNAEFATDMLDELLTGFAPRPRAEPADLDTTQVLHVDAHDVGEHWYLTITGDGIDTSREGGQADLTVRATADELYRLLWNRTVDSTIELDGDPGVLDAWRTACRVRWSGGE